MTTQNLTAIKALTFVMFMMFAMTTDSVGIIIPEIIKTFHLSLTAAGSFQYATMSGIAWQDSCSAILPIASDASSPSSSALQLFAAASYLVHRRQFVLVFLRADGSFGRCYRHLQDCGARPHRRHRDIDQRAHVDHEHGGRLLRRRLDHRSRDSGPPSDSRPLLAMALRDCRNDVRAADHHRGIGSLSNSQTDAGTSLERNRRNYEPLHSGLLSWSILIRGGRIRGLRLDAHADRGLSRARCVASRLQHFHLLRAARRRTIPRLVDAESIPVDGRSRAVLRTHPGLLCRQRCGRCQLGRLAAPAFGPVHVGDLPDHQFQRHQLPA